MQQSSECAYSTSFISPHVALSARVVAPWSTLQGAETLTAGGGNMWAALNPSADTPLTPPGEMRGLGSCLRPSWRYMLI